MIQISKFKKGYSKKSDDNSLAQNSSNADRE